MLVTEAHLRALQQDLQALTPENCQTRFPTTEGFFFGSTAYDEAYWADVEGVRRWLSEITETFDFDAESLFLWPGGNQVRCFPGSTEHILISVSTGNAG